MDIKTSELTGDALNWAVEHCEGWGHAPQAPDYSTDWSQAGPIIERERICVTATPSTHWDARTTEYPPTYHSGPTPLVAAMRCYVASKLGDKVTVFNELL